MRIVTKTSLSLYIYRCVECSNIIYDISDIIDEIANMCFGGKPTFEIRGAVLGHMGLFESGI